MKLKQIKLKNYRGCQSEQQLPLSKFTSIVGKNDSGKSIVLNAISSFLNAKEYPITISDYNNQENEIVVECQFQSENMKELLESKVKTKVKKTDGLEEFVQTILFDNKLIVRKSAIFPQKGFSKEEILIKDFELDDFSGLYFKTDEEIREVLDKFKIEVPIEGKGRNSKLEKIKFILKYCDENVIPTIERYIEDDFKISSLLPDVELFVSDYGLVADTKFKSNSVSEIQTYLTKESEPDQKLDVVFKEIENEMQNEATSIQSYMNDYVSSLQNIELKPTVAWKDAIKSVDVSFQFEGDDSPIPMSHKGTGYRRLFMVARFRYLAEKKKGDNILYLIEEPETFLHPSAQEDLLNAFRELSDDNQIIITTHSPVFTGATNIDSVILCTKDNQSLYSYVSDGNKNEFVDKITKELGIKPSYNLRDSHEKIVFVESHNDANFFELICDKLLRKSMLNNDKILVLPFGGGEDIDSFLNIDYFDSSGRNLYLIIDSDKHIDNEEKQNTRASSFSERKEKGVAYVLNKSCLENYYHPRAFERLYDLEPSSFGEINDNDNVRQKIKNFKSENNITSNIKEKNNFDVFGIMTDAEWKEVIEDDLVTFLNSIVE